MHTLRFSLTAGLKQHLYHILFLYDCCRFVDESFNLKWFLLQTETKMVETAQFMQIYRSREVGQSYLTSVWTTLIAMAHALWLMTKIRPQVVLPLSLLMLPGMYVLIT